MSRTHRQKCFDVIIIGAGHHGLACAYHAKMASLSYMVLERARIGNSWRHLWDSFRTNTPSRCNVFPDEDGGNRPSAFDSPEELVGRFEAFARRHDLNILEQTPVQSLSRAGELFEVRTPERTFVGRNVVVCIGENHVPSYPGDVRRAAAAVRHLHSSQYRRPQDIDGPVLLIGGGQSGAQIADELARAGKRVYWSQSARSMNLRVLGGSDYLELWNEAGILHCTLQELPKNPILPSQELRAIRRVKFPIISGNEPYADGSVHLTYKRLSGQGVTLLGRVEGCADGALHFADDVEADIRRSVAQTRQIVGYLEEIVRAQGRSLPRGATSSLLSEIEWVPPERVTSLPIETLGTIIYTSGFKKDWSWIKIRSLFDDDGYPLGQRGVSVVPGIYFVGLFFLQRLSSTCLCNGGADADDVVQHIQQMQKASHHPQQRHSL
jgi:putative flavoprotein involved in K+ transport